MPKSTIHDVAGLAQVSIKTVSRVVNREPNVSESTRSRVEKAIRKLDYRPNVSARNLASLHSHLICLIYEDPAAFENPSGGYIVRMQEGSLRACRTSNYELLIHPCNYRNREFAGEIRALIQQTRPAGIILAAPLSNTPRILDAIAATGTPVVPLSPGKSLRNHYTVSTNDREISAEMTRYLAGLGHRRIGFVTGHPGHKAVGRRYLGYRDGLGQSSLDYDQQVVVAGDNSFGSGIAAGEALLNLDRPPTAIFAANDDMAAGVMTVAARRGISIPGQLSVAGCDDISLARQTYPTLTTIRQPLATMAEKAALALVGESRSGSSPEGAEVVPATLQIRESTGPAPQADNA